MKKTLLIFTTLVLSQLVYVSVSFGSETLSGEQIKDLIVGKTIDGINKKGVPFQRTFYEDGKAIRLKKGTERNESWAIKQNKLCRTSPGKENCATIKSSGDKYFALGKKGSTVYTFIVK